MIMMALVVMAVMIGSSYVFIKVIMVIWLMGLVLIVMTRLPVIINECNCSI